MQQLPSFNIIGIAVRTSNENNQSATDIPALWGKFMAEGIADKIPGKISNDVYCLYTDYEKDHTRPYTTVLGCRVSRVDHVPEGMVSLSVEDAAYTKFTANGDLMQGVVFNEWLKIWNADIPRTFRTDFEIYGAKAQDRNNAEVDIFVGVEQ